MTSNLQVEIDLLRQRALRNELTLEEVKRAVVLLREARGKAYMPTTKAAKAAKPSVDTTKLLEGL